MAGRPRTPRMLAWASGLLLCLTGCVPGGQQARSPETVDLLGQDWAFAPGVTAAGDGLHVSPTGLRIVGQDGSGEQPDPPVNLYGTHLAVGGDFSVTATIAGATADASLALYDTPPLIADEFRLEPAGVRLTLRGHDLEVVVHDGSAPDDVTDPAPVADEHVTLRDPGAPLTVERSGPFLRVASGGRTVVSVDRGDVFASGRVWLGLSSDDGSFTVPSLTAGAPDGRVSAVDAARDLPAASSDGLQALAARVRPGFRIGAAAALGPLSGDADYARELLSDFGSLTPENAMKPQALAPRQGVYVFAAADALVDAAQRSGMTVHGHTLAFGEALPGWMRDLPSGTAAERASSGAVLLDYVRTVVTHFRGRVQSWDVVNEPFDPDQGTAPQETVWSRVLGPDYPAAVSQTVYAADPQAAQFINENGADVPGPRQDALLALARHTNALGGHITGVGLQAHVYDLATDAVPADDLTASLDLFGRNGLQVRISENDVTDGGGTAAQADQYAAVLGACLRNPACVSWTTWGVDDRYDWFVDDDGSLQQGHDLLFDEGEPTAAYDAVRRVLGG